MTSRRAPRMTALAAKYTPPEWLRGSAYGSGSFCNAVPLDEVVNARNWSLMLLLRTAWQLCTSSI